MMPTEKKSLINLGIIVAGTAWTVWLFVVPKAHSVDAMDIWQLVLGISALALVCAIISVTIHFWVKAMWGAVLTSVIATTIAYVLIALTVIRFNSEGQARAYAFMYFPFLLIYAVPRLLPTIVLVSFGTARIIRDIKRGRIERRGPIQ